MLRSRKCSCCPHGISQRERWCTPGVSLQSFGKFALVDHWCNWVDLLEVEMISKSLVNERS